MAKYKEHVEYKITGTNKRGKKVTFPSCYLIDGVWYRKWFYIPDGGNPENRGTDPDQELGWEYKPFLDFNDIKVESIEEVKKKDGQTD